MSLFYFFRCMTMACLLSSFGLVCSAQEVNFSVSEGFTFGSLLRNHPDWIGQNEWSVEGSGDGVALCTSGGYIRASYLGAAAPNNIVDSFRVSATFALLGDFFSSTNNLPNFAETAFVLNITETRLDAPPGVMGAAIAVEDDVEPPELELRLVGAAGGSIRLGSATNYNGHTFVLDVEYTRTDATTYTVVARLDSLDDAGPPLTVVDMAAVPPRSFSDSGEVFGFMQAVPAVAEYYNGVEVEKFSFETVEPDSVSFTPVFVDALSAVDGYQFFTDLSVLQVSTNLPVWQDVPDSISDAPDRRYILSDRPDAPITYYRLADVSQTPFADDFEIPGFGGWATLDAGGQDVWERGTPGLQNAFITNIMANSGTQCWGIDLDNDYAMGTDATLISPIIQLPPSGPLTLEYFEFSDFDDTPAPGDKGLVRVVDIDTGVTSLLRDSGGVATGWQEIALPIPASALGHRVQFHFQFLDDGDAGHFDGWGGWYIDDVRVTD